MPGALEPGTVVSHYRIVSSLGVGGMGEVYRAHDSSLDRAVALKILPPELVRNDDRVPRFVQEAKSASSLNHPHIVTIHEIGTADSIHYIAMELVDGLTLKSKIHSEATDLKTLLVYLTQAAEGLAKAHAAGIVHRDLKPENIMITRDGYAKVLDFGLAKLTIRSEGGTNAPTQARNHTREGAVMGTVAYMSPEQVQGKIVDHRSDIFSFGCILYEAATRRRPFEADSDIDVMHQIVHDKPVPIDEINPIVPAELRRVIRRCLAKEPDKRFQSMKDVAIDLADIVDEFDELSSSTASASVSASSPGIAPVRKRQWWATASIAAVVIAAIGFVEWRRLHHVNSTALQSMRIQRITNSGGVRQATISPDGRYVAYVLQDENFTASLVVRQVATGSTVRIAGPTSTTALSRPTFSPDGNYLFYGEYDSPALGRGMATLFQVATLGGEPRKVLTDVDTPLSFSPDGTQIAFGRGMLGKNENDTVVARVDGTGERVISTSKRVGLVSTRPVQAVWTSDGKKLVTARSSMEGGAHDELIEIDATGGHERVVGGRWLAIRGVAWLPDGSGLIMAASQGEIDRSQLWLQPFPDGEPRRISNDLNYYLGVALTSDGKTIATVQNSVRSQLRETSVGNEAGGRPLIPELRDELIVAISTSATGRTAYTVAGDSADIYVLDPGGSPKQVMTSGMGPSISADGTTICFNSRRNGGVPHVWVANTDGSNARQVTRGAFEGAHSMAPDGTWVAFAEVGKGIRRVELSTGAVTSISDVRGAIRPIISRDGKQIAYTYYDAGSNFRVAVVPSHGGRAIVDVPNPGSGVWWSLAGDALTFQRLKDGSTNIWKLPLDGTAPTQLTHFKGVRFDDYAWLPDGKIVYSSHEETNDLVLISDFR
jgi:serine/threonine protein kinase